MFNQASFIRKASFWVVCAAFFVVSIVVSPASAQDCQAALSSSMAATAVTNGNSASKANGVDEWDGDVLKIYTPLPGVLEIEGAGDGSQSSLYTEGSSSFHPLVDSEYLGTDLGDLQVIIPAGTHCIQVAPGPEAEGNFEVEATFIDACHLGETDDHGGSFLCSTPVEVDDENPTEAEITVPSSGNDYDMFTFVLTSAETVTIESAEDTDVAASLYDASGVLLEADDNDGADANFQIIRSLNPGRYYVRVEGVSDTGDYEVSVTTP